MMAVAFQVGFSTKKETAQTFPHRDEYLYRPGFGRYSHSCIDALRRPYGAASVKVSGSPAVLGWFTR